MSLVSPLIPSEANFVSTTLNYSTHRPTLPLTEKWSFSSGAGRSDVNFDSFPVAAKVYDLRGQESRASLSATGFQPLTSPSSVPAEFILNSSEEEIAKVYYPEVEALLLKHTGASRVIFFDNTVRRPVIPGSTEGPSRRGPVLRAHSDQTPASSHRRVLRHDKSGIPYKRFQLINVWRPLVNTVYDYPLAVCDFNTLDVNEDLVPTNLVYPPPLPVGETYSLKYNDKHRWWFWSQMTPDDVLLLKIYDSASREMTKVKVAGADVQESELLDVAGTTPHTSFLDEEAAKKGIQRHSIEVRTLVFYDK